MSKFVIQKKFKNERLDKFLVKKFPQYSRSYLQKNIKEGRVKVKSEIVEPDYKLEAGDTVETKIKPQEKVSLAPNPSILLDIVDEDDDLMVINKSSGLVVHAGVKNPKNTLVNALFAHCPKIKGVGDDPSIRPGIVHRLDKDVSGLMVIAKNNKTFQYLKKQFKQRKVKKVYTALVWGKFKQKKGKIDLPIAQNPKNPAKMVVVRDPKNRLAQKAQTALTEFRVLENFTIEPPLLSLRGSGESKERSDRSNLIKTNECNTSGDCFVGSLRSPPRNDKKGFDNLALIRVYLKTGRRHQIRVHFKSLSHPLVNDRLYGNRNQKILGTGRIFLHSTELGFSTPSGKKLKFTSPLPKKLEEILRCLGSGSKKCPRAKKTITPAHEQGRNNYELT